MLVIDLCSLAVLYYSNSAQESTTRLRLATTYISEKVWKPDNPYTDKTTTYDDIVQDMLRTGVFGNLAVVLDDTQSFMSNLLDDFCEITKVGAAIARTCVY
jgi:hypothetical protein